MSADQPFQIQCRCAAYHAADARKPGKIGAEIHVDSSLREDKMLFSETPGFVIEVKPENKEKVLEIFKKYNCSINEIGKTVGDSLIINKGETELVNLSTNQLKKAWTSGIREALL